MTNTFLTETNDEVHINGFVQKDAWPNVTDFDRKSSAIVQIDGTTQTISNLSL
jgi:hypothetical protein